MIYRSRIFLVLAGLTVGLAVVAAALAVALLDDPGSSITTASNTLQPTATPVSDSAGPDDVSADLRARIEALPEKLRKEVIAALADGSLPLSRLEEVLRAYETRNTGVRVGSVIEASSSRLALEVYNTGERVEVAIDDRTVLRRGPRTITGAELERDELVMVISMDGGVTAFSVTAFGISAP